MSAAQRWPAPSAQDVAAREAREGHSAIMFDVIAELAAVKLPRSRSSAPGTVGHLVLRARVIEQMVREAAERQLHRQGVRS